VGTRREERWGAEEGELEEGRRLGTGGGRSFLAWLRCVRRVSRFRRRCWISGRLRLGVASEWFLPLPCVSFSSPLASRLFSRRRPPRFLQFIQILLHLHLQPFRPPSQDRAPIHLQSPLGFEDLHHHPSEGIDDGEDRFLPQEDQPALHEAIERQVVVGSIEGSDGEFDASSLNVLEKEGRKREEKLT